MSDERVTSNTVPGHRVRVSKTTELAKHTDLRWTAKCSCGDQASKSFILTALEWRDTHLSSVARGQANDN